MKRLAHILTIIASLLCLSITLYILTEGNPQVSRVQQTSIRTDSALYGFVEDSLPLRRPDAP